MKNRIIFVYNANSGLFNTFADIAHKAISPGTYKCSLCNLTHDLFNEKKEWTDFIEGLNVDCEFLHIDEFRRKYISDVTDFPAIFTVNSGQASLLMNRKEIDGSRSLADLKKLVRAIVGELKTPKSEAKFMGN